MKKCPYCAEMIQDDATVCRFCGSHLPAAPAAQTNISEADAYDPWNRNDPFAFGPEGRSRGIAALLSFFFGCLGIQYFYMGKTGAGILCVLLTMVDIGLWFLATGVHSGFLTVLAWIISACLYVTLMLMEAIILLCMPNEQFRQKYILSASPFPIF